MSQLITENPYDPAVDVLVAPEKAFEFPSGFGTSTVLRADGSGAWVVTREIDSNIWDILIYYWPEWLLLLLIVVLLWRTWRLIKRWRAGEVLGELYCRKCNYHLRGITSPTCPECGHALAEGGARRARGRTIFVFTKRGLYIAAIFYIAGLMLFESTEQLQPFARRTAVNHWFYWPSRTVYELDDEWNFYRGDSQSVAVYDVTFANIDSPHRILKAFDMPSAWMSLGGDVWFDAESGVTILRANDEFYRIELMKNEVRALKGLAAHEVIERGNHLMFIANGHELLLLSEDAVGWLKRPVDPAISQEPQFLWDTVRHDAVWITEKGTLVHRQQTYFPVPEDRWTEVDPLTGVMTPLDEPNEAIATNDAKTLSKFTELNTAVYPQRDFGPRETAILTLPNDPAGVKETWRVPPVDFESLYGEIDELPVSDDRRFVFARTMNAVHVWDDASEWVELCRPFAPFGNGGCFVDATNERLLCAIPARTGFYPGSIQVRIYRIADIEAALAARRAEGGE